MSPEVARRGGAAFLHHLPGNTPLSCQHFTVARARARQSTRGYPFDHRGRPVQRGPFSFVRPSALLLESRAAQRASSIPQLKTATPTTSAAAVDTTRSRSNRQRADAMPPQLLPAQQPSAPPPSGPAFPTSFQRWAKKQRTRQRERQVLPLPPRDSIPAFRKWGAVPGGGTGGMYRGVAAAGGPSDNGGRSSTSGDLRHGAEESRTAASTAAAFGFLVRSVRSWPEALQLLDTAGGPEGRPPPRLQLDLLLQSRRFRRSGSVADGGDRCSAASSRPHSCNWSLEAGFDRATRGDGGSAGSGLAMSEAAEEAAAGAIGAPWAVAEEGDPTGEWAFGAADLGGSGLPAAAAVSSAGSMTAVAALAAADVRWQVDWELEWDAQVQLHSEWLRQDPPPPQLHVEGGRSHGAPPAAAPSARTAAAVMLPGHAAAAAALAAAAAGMTRFSPIPPMRTAAGGVPPAVQARELPPSTSTAFFRAELQPGRSISQSLQAPQLQRRAATAGQQTQAVPSLIDTVDDAAAAAQSPPARRRLVRDDATALAAEVLLRVANDAAVVQPHAWTNDDVAKLLRRAAKIVYRHPGLLPPIAAAAASQTQYLQQKQQSSSSLAGVPHAESRPSYKRNSAVGVLPPAQPSGLDRPAFDKSMSQHDPRVPDIGNLDGGRAVGSGAAAVGGYGDIGGTVGSQLRVRLQQLLLRLDGVLTPTTPVGRSQPPTPQREHVVIGAKVPNGPPTPQPQQPLRSASAAVSAVWAAAALQLRLSPEGDVRRRLLAEFRPQRRLRLATAASGGGQQRRLRRRRRRLQRPGPTAAAAGPVGSAPHLGEGDVADMLWAFAVLGLRMNRFQLDRALRAAADPTPPRGLQRLLAGRNRPRPPATQQPAVASAVTATGAGGGVGGGRGTGGDRQGGDLQANGIAAAGAAGGGGGGAGGGGISGGKGAGLGLRPGGLARLRPSQLTAVAWAAVELSEAAAAATATGGSGGGGPGPGEGVTAVWAARLFASTQTRMSRLSPSQLVDLLWSVGRGRRTPTGPWRTAAAAALGAAAPRLTPWQLARAAAGMAKLRVSLPYTLVSELLSLLHRQLDASQASDVAAMVWALPYITYPYTELFVRRHRRPLLDLAIATSPRLPSLDPPQLVQLADGFARLGQLPGAEWMRAHREACIRLKTRFSEANRRKIRSAYAIMLSL